MEKTPLLPPRKDGLCFIVSAPAGTGKTTLVKMLVEEFPRVVSSISYTTRKKRQGETEGKDYHFITKEAFEAKIAASDFLEYVQLYGDYYGTCRKWVLDKMKQGIHVVLVIDTQGAMQLKKLFTAVYIFISPPSLEVLKERLAKRKTESPDAMVKRIAWAAQEMAAAPQYDYHIINDDLSTAYQVLRSIVIAETHRGEKSG